MHKYIYTWTWLNEASNAKLVDPCSAETGIFWANLIDSKAPGDLAVDALAPSPNVSWPSAAMVLPM